MITGEKAFPIAANIGQYLRVTAGSTTADNGVPVVSLAGVADNDIGVTTRAAFVSTAPAGQTIDGSVTVRLRSAQGTIRYTVSGAVTTFMAPLYTAASGKVSSSQASGASLIGYSLGLATADGDVIEVLPL